jgi:hypothetical protein
MSKCAHALILGTMLAAINLVGLTAVAHAQANDPDGKDAPAAGHRTSGRRGLAPPPSGRRAAHRR